MQNTASGITLMLAEKHEHTHMLPMARQWCAPRKWDKERATETLRRVRGHDDGHDRVYVRIRNRGQIDISGVLCWRIAAVTTAGDCGCPREYMRFYGHDRDRTCS